jgi:DNA-binding transcriptional MocR family regulator
MFEDWSVDVDQADDERAGKPLGHGADLLPLDHQILGLLAAHDGPAGICPSLARVADKLGVSRRHVRRRLAELEAAGLVERVAVFERDDDPEWQRRGRRPSHPRRQTSNSYRLSGSSEPCPTPPRT